VFYELLDSGSELEKLIPIFSSNVARLMNFHDKGHLSIGADADLVVLNKNKRIEHVMALGQWHVFNQEIIKKGTFEN
jgi:beta-aspartyl-dipeptidase (metallo-type)